MKTPVVPVAPAGVGWLRAAPTCSGIDARAKDDLLISTLAQIHMRYVTVLRYIFETQALIRGCSQYGLVGTDRTLTTPTAASGLVAAAAPSGYHQRTVSSYSLPDTPTSMGPVVRPTSAMALAHTRVPSSPNGSFSLPPNAAMPLVDVSSSHNGGVSPASPAISTHRRSGSGSPVSMDFGAIGARPPSVLSHATSATSDTVAPSLLSPMSRDYGALGIRPMSTSTVATSTTTRADRPASHQRGSSFGSSALAAVDSVVAGRVSGQVAPLPPSPRTLKSSEASSTARSPTTPVIVHQDAGPAASAAEPPAYSR